MQKVIEMDREEAREAAKVMLAYADGAEIQILGKDDWCDVPEANFDWENMAYRVKPRKPSINWDHVGENLNWLVIQRDGGAQIFETKPGIAEDVHRKPRCWLSEDGSFSAKAFASFDPGDCDWKDSLVERPK
jgi:hypothetical protein